MSCKVKSDCTTLRCASNEMIITAKKEVFGESLSGLTWIGNLPITIDGNGDLEISMELGAEGMTHHLSTEKVHFKGRVEIFYFHFESSSICPTAKLTLKVTVERASQIYSILCV